MTRSSDNLAYLRNKDFLGSASLSVLLLLVSLVVNWYAGIYATESASSSVTDIILSNTRAYDVDWIFIYGAFVFWAFTLFLCIRDPKLLPFTFASIALFVLIRSVFISLTHIGPFPTQIPLDSDLLNKFSFGGDLFFSGHTGLPFLMALVYWKDRTLRMLFIFAAVLFGVVVLLTHLHYSIDVLSAFFITYSIFHIAELFFKKERQMFYHGITSSPS